MTKRVTRRSFLMGMGMGTIGAGLALVPATILAQEKKPPADKEKKLLRPIAVCSTSSSTTPRASSRMSRSA